MDKYTIKLTGTSDLLLHWDNIDWADELARWRSVPENKKQSVAGDDRSPPFTWQGYVYNDGNVVVIPFDNIRSCLMDAGTKIPNAKGKGSLKREAVSDVLIDDIYVPLLIDGKPIRWEDISAIKGTYAEQCEAAKKLGFVLFAKRAVVGSSKHVRVRPRFSRWSLEFGITVNGASLSREIIVELFRVAGQYCGLCDWRPGEKKSPGPFGRFTAEVKK